MSTASENSDENSNESQNLFVEYFDENDSETEKEHESDEDSYSDSEIELFPSFTGKNTLSLRHYCYSISSTTDKKIYWRCDEFRSKECQAKVQTTTDMKHLLEVIGAHPHPPDVYKAARQKKCKPSEILHLQVKMSKFLLLSKKTSVTYQICSIK